MKNKELQLNKENLTTNLKENKNNNKTNKEKENKIMMNRTNAKEMRMETLKANGVNVNNFFNLSMQIPFGAEVKILVNGQEMIIPASNEFTQDENFNGISYMNGVTDKIDFTRVDSSKLNLMGDTIAQEIMENGYVKNSKLFRRWITAQTFRMLNYKSYREPNRIGWEACMKDCFDYNYQFTMLLEEIRVLSILQKEDPEAFAERTHFFNGDVVVASLYDYKHRLEKYINKQRKEKARKYKGKEYVKLAKYGNVFVNDLDEQVYKRIEQHIVYVRNACKYGNYKNIYIELKDFMDRAYNKLPYDTTKCQQWKDAFKASGGYYSLLNLIRFHNVLIKDCEDKYESELHLNQLLDVFKGEEWRFHNLLVRTIEYNNFDLRKSIVEGNCAPNTSIARKYNK